jgi:hypothetical protein
MAYDLGEYKDIFETLAGLGGKREGRAIEDLGRLYASRGVGTASAIGAGAAELRERTAEAETGLGAQLASRAGGEAFQSAEAGKSREDAMRRLLISESGAKERLEKQLKAQMELEKWRWEQEKAYADEQRKSARKAGFAQMGLSALTGGISGALAPTLFGAGTTPLKGFGLGALTGAPTVAGLFTRNVGYSTQPDIMELFRQLGLGSRTNDYSVAPAGESFYGT